MKNKHLAQLPILFLLALCLATGACSIPRYKVSYSHLVQQHYSKMKEAGQSTAALVPDTCLHIYEGYYPYCAKLRPSERILEGTLALDNNCQDTASGFHRFSLIEIRLHQVVERVANVLFVSFSQTENQLPAQPVRSLVLGTGSSNDTLEIRGAVTLYSGVYENDSTIFFSRQFVYTTPPKFSVFSRGNRLKKETPIALRMVIAKTNGGSQHQAYIKRMVNYGRNELSDSKPLVFRLSDVFNIDALAMPYFLSECVHAP